MVDDGTSLVAAEGEAIDFALAAFREEGIWQVQEVTAQSLESADTLADALRREWPCDVPDRGATVILRAPH